MEASALLLMLDRLLDLIERNLHSGSADDLQALRTYADRITGLLVRLAERPPRGAAPAEITAPLVHAIVATRWLRADRFGPDMGEAGWALLLMLYAARLDGRTYSATRLGAAAGLRQSTSLRWIHALRAKGLLTWQADPEDERTAAIALNDHAAAKVESYLKTALQISPIIL